MNQTFSYYLQIKKWAKSLYFYYFLRFHSLEKWVGSCYRVIWSTCIQPIEMFGHDRTFQWVEYKLIRSPCNMIQLIFLKNGTLKNNKNTSFLLIFLFEGNTKRFDSSIFFFFFENVWFIYLGGKKIAIGFLSCH